MGIMNVGVMYLHFRNISSDRKLQSIHATHNISNLSDCLSFLFGCPRPGPTVSIFRNCISSNICRCLWASGDIRGYLEAFASIFRYLLVS